METTLIYNGRSGDTEFMGWQAESGADGGTPAGRGEESSGYSSGLGGQQDSGFGNRR